MPVPDQTSPEPSEIYAGLYSTTRDARQEFTSASVILCCTVSQFCIGCQGQWRRFDGSGIACHVSLNSVPCSRESSTSPHAFASEARWGEAVSLESQRKQTCKGEKRERERERERGRVVILQKACMKLCSFS